MSTEILISAYPKIKMACFLKDIKACFDIFKEAGHTGVNN